MNWAEAMQFLFGASFSVLTVSVTEGVWNARVAEGSSVALESTVRYDALAEAQRWAEGNGYKVLGQWVGDPDSAESGYRKLAIS